MLNYFQGGDIGGYDVSERDYLDLNYCKETNSVRFSHMEYELYEAQRKGLITYDEFLELNNESEYEVNYVKKISRILTISISC